MMMQWKPCGTTLKALMSSLLASAMLAGCSSKDCASDLSKPLSACLETRTNRVDPQSMVYIRCERGSVLVRAGSITGMECQCMGRIRCP